jgi:hypothetical protein
MPCSPPDEKAISLGRIMTLYSRDVQTYGSLAHHIKRNQCPFFNGPVLLPNVWWPRRHENDTPRLKSSEKVWQNKTKPSP